jgi:hypothetical protein
MPHIEGPVRRPVGVNESHKNFSTRENRDLIPTSTQNPMGLLKQRSIVQINPMSIDNTKMLKKNNINYLKKTKAKT